LTANTRVALHIII